jgi:hypothetical protein
MWRSNNTIKNMKTGLLSNKMYTSKKEEDVLSKEGRNKQKGRVLTLQETDLSQNMCSDLLEKVTEIKTSEN